MQLIVALLAIASLAAAATAAAAADSVSPPAVNTSQEYQLQIHLKGSQSNKERFVDLWLVSYHTGAGMSDAAFSDNRTLASNGYFNATGSPRNVQNFNLGSVFPWYMEMVENEVFYAAWQPVRINAGTGGTSSENSGFFVNNTGLQWTSLPGTPGAVGDTFGGWLVCDWWHGLPQLFFRIGSYKVKDYPAPLSCADIDLIPHYI